MTELHVVREKRKCFRPNFVELRGFPLRSSPPAPFPKKPPPSTFHSTHSTKKILLRIRTVIWFFFRAILSQQSRSTPVRLLPSGVQAMILVHNLNEDTNRDQVKKRGEQQSQSPRGEDDVRIPSFGDSTHN
jgi:hypothetical protein